MIIQPFGMYARAGNVPVRITKEQRYDYVGRYNRTIYSYPAIYTNKILIVPDDDTRISPNPFHPAELENRDSAAEGFKWVWRDMANWIARELRKRNKKSDWEHWKGCDLMTALDYMQYYTNHAKGHGTVHYYIYEQADVIEQLTPEDQIRTRPYMLYRLSRNRYVFVKQVAKLSLPPGTADLPACELEAIGVA